ncbi:ribonuclease H-like domain-containing protein [Tanacetum coccineum]
MYVHNFDDGDDYVDDRVTLISRLDTCDPLHLQPNDSTTLTVVSIKLKGIENYQVWSCDMLLALEEKNKTGFIDGSCRSEESHIVASGSVFGSSQRNQASAFVSNVPNKGNFQRGQSSKIAHRPNNLNNNRQSEGSGLNSKGKDISNNNVVGSSSSSGFTDEQIAALISLIKDNKVGKNVQANMIVIVNRKIIDSGANQHMTNTDIELDNVYDISHLKIKVGHPNGTEAFISKIGNLKLPNGLVLFDVLVNPEYCVTLIFVHKLTKDNKIFVAFDESRCYFLNQDLNLKKVLGIGNQYGGLYYFNDKGLGSRSEKCVMMGYSNYKKGYRLYSLKRHQFTFSRDVKFFESMFPFKDSVSKEVDTSNSDSSYSSVPDRDMNTVDFSDDKSGNDA